MFTTPDAFWFVVVAPPIVLSCLVLGILAFEWRPHYYGSIVVFLSLALGAWTAYCGLGTFGILLWPGFFFNPLIVGLLCTRRPIAFGLLTNIAAILSFNLWPLKAGFDMETRHLSGWTSLLELTLIGVILSLLTTVPIAIYREVAIYRQEKK